MRTGSVSRAFYLPPSCCVKLFICAIKSSRNAWHEFRGLITGYNVRARTTVLVTPGDYVIKARAGRDADFLIPVSKTVVYPNGRRVTSAEYNRL